jgi:hypothetical protein
LAQLVCRRHGPIRRSHLRGGYSILAKILAIIALVVLAAMLALFASDVQLVLRWIRGVAV